MPSRFVQGLLFLGLCSLSLASAQAAEKQRGVTDTEIVIGTVTDLSGVTAVQGVNNSDAIRMAFDEANAKGGINGRKIKYIVEDSQYTGAACGAGDEQAAEQRRHLHRDWTTAARR